MKINVKGLGTIEAENTGPNVLITAVAHSDPGKYAVVEVSKQEWLKFCQAGMALTK